jgi:hypothetical protein
MGERENGRVGDSQSHALPLSHSPFHSSSGWTTTAVP